jgi:pyruvate/2-oxoglutarate/acetoin dehydrogenase E1 component
MAGIPGIDVIAPSIIHDPVAVFKNIYADIDRPTIVIEDKALYGQKLFVFRDGKIGDFFVSEENAAFPLITMSLDPDETADVAILTYGGLVKDAITAAEKLMMEEEILAKIIVFTRISPVNYSAVVKEIGDISKITTVEAGTERVGWGAEIVAAISERTQNKKFKRIAAVNLPIPCNKFLEDQMIPDSDMIIKEIKKFK